MNSTAQPPSPRVVDPRKTNAGGVSPFAPVVLALDDEPCILEMIAAGLADEPYEILLASDGPAALSILEQRPVDLVISDLQMAGMGGLEFVERIRRSEKDVDVLILTGCATVENVIRCMQLKTVDLIQKPFEVPHLKNRVREILQKRLLQLENRKQHDQPLSKKPALLGNSQAMETLRHRIRRASSGEEIVLIRGESGTGKELVARTLHDSGNRSGGPFVAVDCTTLSPTVIESELFGHVRGAFTGAQESREGLFRSAGAGTVFLDEISELPLELQPKLLRALQEREVRPVGSSQSVSFGARILAATNRDLEKMVREGKFREDLYWRINVVTFRVPPLRERREDILPLARHFAAKHSVSSGLSPAIDASVGEMLERFAWPGNVRELENCIRRMLVLYPDTLTLEELLPGMGETPAKDEAPRATLSEHERRAIVSALAETRGNVRQAARNLATSKSTLYRKIEAYGINSSSPSSGK